MTKSERKQWKRINIDGTEMPYLISDSGDVYSIKYDKLLKPRINISGYMEIEISINKKSYYKGIHRLVAETFIPNPENKSEVNHIDANKQNNTIANLEWCTHAENMKHAAVNNLIRNVGKGENNPSNKYSESVIHEICKMLENGCGNKYIAETLNVNKNLVKHIKDGDTWLYISKNYDIPKPNKTPRRSSALTKSIEILIASGFTNSEIRRMVGLKKTSRNKSYIKSIRQRLNNNEKFNDYRKGSTEDTQIGEILLFTWELE